MMDFDKSNDTEKKKVSVTRVTNHSTCDLPINGVLIRIGKTEDVPDFDPSTKINSEWVRCKMISVKP
jgi:hypothetical protein